MEPAPDVSILAVDRLHDGIIVRFSDGTCVFFSAALLYEHHVQATLLDETVTAW